MSAQAFNEFYLKVSDIHQVHVREFGNPNGIPCVFLHGGPGGGCSASDAEFFDLDLWRVVMFDQRGCGQSKPHSELRENTTWDLVSDIEKIRSKLAIERWAVFGGSWGSTLSLAYAQSYPNAVLALFLRGIFLCRQEEIDWFYEGKGANWLYPQEFEDFIQPIANVSGASNVEKYYKLLTSEDPQVRKNAGKVWTMYEGKLSTLVPNMEKIKQFSGDEFADAFARIECHYFINHSFFNTNNALLKNVNKIAHIPGVIVHGRYDVICPLKSAYELHRLWPQSKLFVSPSAGHASGEIENKTKLRSLTLEYAKTGRFA